MELNPEVLLLSLINQATTYSLGNELFVPFFLFFDIIYCIIFMVINLRNIKIIIEYDGKKYFGWQRQPNKTTVQSEIEKAIYKVTGEEVVIYSSGRTDAGVCAYNQVANFKIKSDIDIKKIPLALNAHLKKSIIIKSAEEVDERFHSRYCCVGKKYMYIINNSKYGSAINREREFHMPKELNIEDMKKALKFFEGTHDFKGFKSSGTSSKDTVRTIYEANLEYKDEKIYITLHGNGFMYNMVRIIAGTIVDVGLGKIKKEDIPDIIKSGVRKNAGKTLPAQGLYLMEVYY